MKYLCIKTSSTNDSIFKGVIYNLEKNYNEGNDVYWIDGKWTIDENNLKSYFIPFAEFREQRINKILE
jgi:hypothetical protein